MQLESCPAPGPLPAAVFELGRLHGHWLFSANHLTMAGIFLSKPPGMKKFSIPARAFV